MTNRGIVHTKPDRHIYVGRTSNVPVNRIGYPTMKDAAVAQNQAMNQQAQTQTQASGAISSIEVYGEVSAADVDAAEKRKTVHPATHTPYKRQAMNNDFRAPVTRSQTQPPSNFVPPATFIPFVPTPAAVPAAAPSGIMEDDTDMPEIIKEPRIRKVKQWSNWQLSARDKLRTGGPGDL